MCIVKKKKKKKKKNKKPKRHDETLKHYKKYIPIDEEH